jgi:YD repeat-containing protein
MRWLDRWTPSISLLLCTALLANLTNGFGLLNPRFVLAASSPSGDSSQTDVTEVGVAPLGSPTRGAIGRPGNLPIGFGNLATFHENLVQEAEGYFRIAYQDIAIPCQGPGLEVHRIYNSAVTRRTAFGRGWSWSWGVRLDTDQTTGNPVLIDDNNLRIHFGASGGGYEAINSAMQVTLTRNGGVSLLTFVDNSREYFNPSGQLLAIQDPAGRMLRLHYTGTLLTEAVDCVGRKLEFSYAGTHISTITDPLGRKWKYEYDGENLSAAVDPMGRRTEYNYLPSFGWGERMSHVRFPNNVEMVVYYDPLSKRVISLDGPGPMRTKFRYMVNPYERTMREWVTNARGDTSDDLFDGSGLLTKPYQGQGSGGSGGASVPGGSSNSGSPGGQEMLYVAPNSFTGPAYMENTDTHHDTAGAPWVMQSDSGSVTSQDPLGNQTTVQKDSLGRAVQTTDALGQQTQFTWDSDSGQISSVALPNGGSISMQYQQAQLRSYTDATGRTWKTDPITTPSPGGPVSGTRMTDPGGNQTVLDMDQWGNPSKFRDADGGVRTAAFDIVGRMLSITDAAGNTFHYTYDDADNRISVTDPAGVKTEFRYDEMNHLSRITDSLHRSTTITYDVRGLRTAVTLSTGEEKKYEYDPVGNLLAIHSSGGSGDVVSSFAYDKDQRATRATDPLGRAWQTSYDLDGRLTGTITPAGNQTQLLHDADGRLVSVVRPDGSGMQMTCGAGSQQPQTVSYVGAGSTGSTLQLSYQYDLANRLISVSSGTQALQQITYDAAGRAMEFDSPGFTTSYQLDPAGRALAVVSGSTANPQTFHYQYDPDGRVTGMTEPAGQQRTYSYKFNRMAAVQVQDLGAV